MLAATAGCKRTEHVPSTSSLDAFVQSFDTGSTPSAGNCPLGCTGIPPEGDCQGDVLRLCQGGLAACFDCAEYGQRCVFDEVVGVHACRSPSFRNPTCVPQCAGVQCGSDGCGGSCGFCAAGWACDGAACRKGGGPCGDVDVKGACFEDDVLAQCVDGALVLVDCAHLGRHCGVNPSTNAPDCLVGPVKRP